MTDHRAYIDTVGAALRNCGIPIVTAVVTRIAGRREALLRIDPRATATMHPSAAQVDLRWDEDRGWRCVISYPPDTDIPDRCSALGPETTAPPAVVANWIGTVLAGQGMTSGEAATPATPNQTKVTPVAIDRIADGPTGAEAAHIERTDDDQPVGGPPQAGPLQAGPLQAGPLQAGPLQAGPPAGERATGERVDPRPADCLTIAA